MPHDHPINNTCKDSTRNQEPLKDERFQAVFGFHCEARAIVGGNVISGAKTQGKGTAINWNAGRPLLPDDLLAAATITFVAMILNMH